MGGISEGREMGFVAKKWRPNGGDGGRRRRVGKGLDARSGTAEVAVKRELIHLLSRVGVQGHPGVQGQAGVQGPFYG